jgi:multicomponent Na+:H+ antiporter subunit C
MTRFTLYVLVSMGLFSIGVHGLVAHAHLLRKILALNIMGGAVFLLLASISWRNRGVFPDPVPHAMILTGIVVAVSATALGLSLARRIHSETGAAEFPEGDL